MKVSDEERSKIYDFIFCLLNRSADLKTNKKPSSANITSMYWGTSYSRLSKIKSKKEIIDLIKFLHKEDIPFSSISSMQNWKGIPNLDELKKFEGENRWNRFFDYRTFVWKVWCCKRDLRCKKTKLSWKSFWWKKMERSFGKKC